MSMIRHILVVCVGNICRSPMAEALLRNALGAQEITVESAGLGALVGEGASEHAVELMRERGIDISSHQAQQLTPELVSKADLVLVMETGHKKAIETTDATVRGKLFRLGEWRETDIKDPYRQSKAVFEEVLADIDDGIADWVEHLKA
jgi:protein-tyrosine phosphatase